MSVLIGIAGGSASGKTTLADALMAALPSGAAMILSEDRYYKDQSHLSMAARRRVNYDHPRAIDLAIMARQLQALKSGRRIEAPEYDFARHVRRARTTRFAPAAIVIAEGIHLFHPARLRGLFDLRIFVDADEATRLQRRIARDVAERGRTAAFARAQFLATVQPMHLRFTEPLRAHAHVVVSSTACGPDFAPLIKVLRVLHAA